MLCPSTPRIAQIVAAPILTHVPCIARAATHTLDYESFSRADNLNEYAAIQAAHDCHRRIGGGSRAVCQVMKLSGGAADTEDTDDGATTRTVDKLATGGPDDDPDADESEEDLSADGPVARRILEEIANLAPLEDDFFAVGETSDGRGRGLFATKPIAAETYLFDYISDPSAIIDQAEFERRYDSPTGTHADYAVGVMLGDGVHVYLDARDPSSSKHARFMNHAEDEPHRNCECWTLTPPSVGEVRALLFASRDLAVGEELCWNYGEEYWRGRDDKVQEARRPWWWPTWWVA